jgi:hypothetical protein
VTPERPRDALGRPLPEDADPTLIVPGIPDVAELSDDLVWLLALDYLQRELPFHAHEVFEMRWRTATPADRDAWRALAQWGAALTHRARKNRAGAIALSERTLATLSAAPHIPGCIDMGRVESSCREILTDTGAVGGHPHGETRSAR